MCWGWVKKPVAFCITSLSAGYAPDFSSENGEIKAACDQTERVLIGYEGAKTWVKDRGFGGGDVWWEIWKHPHSHLVNRVKDRGFGGGDVWWEIWQHPHSHMVNRVVHMERIARWQTASGKWEERYLDATIC